MKWLKMDCDAQDNLDMRRLVDEWGWEWYGRYWAICGKVGMLVTEKRQTFTLQTNNGDPFPVRLLANDLGTNVERLSDFCQFLADNHLIDKEAWETKNLIFIPKLRDRADEYTRKLLTKSGDSTEKVHLEEEVEVDKEKDVQSTSISDFEDVWTLYPNRQGKKNAQRHFFATVKLKTDLPRIRSALDNYLKSGNVLRGFVKNGSTWFNEWQDWIAPSEIMMKGQANGTDRASGQPGSQQARATFRHDPAKAASGAVDIAESIRKRREGRGERAGPDPVAPRE